MDSQIAEIERLSLDDLRLRWRNTTGRFAPAHLSRALLVRLLAYRLQVQVFGDIDLKSARALDRFSRNSRPGINIGKADSGEEADPALGVSTTKRRASEPLILRPGTLLSREWNGRMETVMVVVDGFAWNGATFTSLSAVAQAITGTKWNGHRFFGVRSQDRAAHSAKGAAMPTDTITVLVRGASTGDGPIRGQSQGKFDTAIFSDEVVR